MKWTHRGAVRIQPAFATALVVCLFGCGGSAQRAPVVPRPVQRGPHDGHAAAAPPFRDLRVDPQAEALERKCDYHTGERCNALDDDCNGIIDDGCGYASGEIQVTVGWDSGADIDLYVTDPSGATLYYNEEHKRSPIGGYLDHDARGDCRREQKNPRIENAYWPAPARGGAYRVELRYFSPCATAATTEATLSVVVDRKLLGAYRYRLEPEQRIEALRFVKR